MGRQVRGSHLCWEASAADKYAEKWWTERGYTFELKKRFQTKSTYKEVISLRQQLKEMRKA